MTCYHPSGTSKVLHPLRGINSHGSEVRKKETPESTLSQMASLNSMVMCD